jgi:hypothetical protein
MGKHSKKIISGDWNSDGLLSYTFLFSNWRGRQNNDY